MSLDSPQEVSPKSLVYQWKSDSTLADIDALSLYGGASGIYDIDAGNNDLMQWNYNHTFHSAVLSVGDYFVMAQAQPAYVASADNAPAIYSSVTKVK